MSGGELKACPFCGAPGKYEDVTQINAGCGGEDWNCAGRESWHRTDAWNRRAPQAPAVPRGEGRPSFEYNGPEGAVRAFRYYGKTEDVPGFLRRAADSIQAALDAGLIRFDLNSPIPGSAIASPERSAQIREAFYEGFSRGWETIQGILAPNEIPKEAFDRLRGVKGVDAHWAEFQGGASPRPVSGSEPEHPLKDFFTGDSHACVTGWNMIGSKADCKSCNPGAKGFPEPEQETYYLSAPIPPKGQPQSWDCVYCGRPPTDHGTDERCPPKRSGAQPEGGE